MITTIITTAAVGETVTKLVLVAEPKVSTPPVAKPSVVHYPEQVPPIIYAYSLLPKVHLNVFLSFPSLSS
jgi:hypothetical protein